MLVDVAAEVVHVLSLGERLAGVCLVGTEVGNWGAGHGVEGHFYVVSVSVFLLLDVTDFLVVHNGGVVRRDVAWQLREVRSHRIDVMLKNLLKLFLIV